MNVTTRCLPWIIPLIVLAFHTSRSEAGGIFLDYVWVYYTQNGQPASEYIEGTDTETIYPDVGTSINVRIYRTAEAPNSPYVYLCYDTTNGWIADNEKTPTLNPYYDFQDVVGPLDAEVWFTVNHEDKTIVHVDWVACYGPDLVVSDVEIDGNNQPARTCAVGQQVQVDIRVHNIGQLIASGCQVGYYLTTARDAGQVVEANRWGSDSHGGICAGCSSPESEPYIFLASDVGPRWFAFKADYEEARTECCEANNITWWGPFLVSPVRLIPEGCSVSIEPAGPIYPGSRLRFHYSIENLTPSTVKIGLGGSIRPNGATDWQFDEDDDYYVDVAPGVQTATRYFDVPLDAAPGSYDAAWGLWQTFVTGHMWQYLDKSSQFIVEQAWGDLGVTLRNVDGSNAIPAGTRIVVQGFGQVMNTNPATFSSLPAGTYVVTGYHAGGTMFGEEMWARSQATVAPNQTTSLSLVRNLPYVSKGVEFYDNRTNVLIPIGGTVPVTTELRAEVTVKNDTDDQLSADVRLLLDRDKLPGFDHDLQATGLANKLSARVFPIVFKLEAMGSYSYNVSVTTTVDGSRVVTDGWDWVPAFTAVPTGNDRLADHFGSPSTTVSHITYCGKSYTVMEHSSNNQPTAWLPYEIPLGGAADDSTFVRDPDLASFILQTAAFRRDCGADLNAMLEQARAFKNVFNLRDPWYVNVGCSVPPTSVLCPLLTKRHVDNAILGTAYTDIGLNLVPCAIFPAAAPADVVSTFIINMLPSEVDMEQDEFKQLALYYQSHAPSVDSRALMAYAGVELASYGELVVEGANAVKKIAETRTTYLAWKAGDAATKALKYGEASVQLQYVCAGFAVKQLEEYALHMSDVHKHVRAAGILSDLHSEVISTSAAEMEHCVTELQSLYGTPTDNAETRQRILQLEKRYAEDRYVHLYGLIEEMLRSTFMRKEALHRYVLGAAYGATQNSLNELRSAISAIESQQSGDAFYFSRYNLHCGFGPAAIEVARHVIGEARSLTNVPIAELDSSESEIALGSSGQVHLVFTNTLPETVTNLSVAVESPQSGITYSASLSTASVSPGEQAAITVTASVPANWLNDKILVGSTEGLCTTVDLPVVLTGTVGAFTSQVSASCEINVVPVGRIIDVNTDRLFVLSGQNANVSVSVSHPSVPDLIVVLKVMSPYALAGLGYSQAVGGAASFALDFETEVYGPYGVEVLLRDGQGNVLTPWYSVSRLVYHVPPLLGDIWAVRCRTDYIFCHTGDVAMAEELRGMLDDGGITIVTTDDKPLSAVLNMAEGVASIAIGTPDRNSLVSWLTTGDTGVNFRPSHEGQMLVQVVESAVGAGGHVVVLSGFRDREIDLASRAFAHSWITALPGAITVDPQPASLNAPWILTGPRGLLIEGNGVNSIQCSEPGEYTMTWLDISGWVSPDVNPSIQHLLGSHTITFAGEYTPDDDSDGICNMNDACPETILGSPVDASGCPPIIHGDLDRDGDVDTVDVGRFEKCTSGPGVPYNAACISNLPTGVLDPDFDEDLDVDQSDFGILQRCLSGENVPADPQCASEQQDRPMVVVGAGLFPYQNTQDPGAWVHVNGFLIDKFEVTNQSYSQFLNEADPNGDHWVSDMEIHRYGDPGSYTYAVHVGRERYPARYVNVYDAEAFAQWRTNLEGLAYRLPTNHEWEKAAAWDPERQQYYLYGFHQDTITCASCNYNNCIGAPMPVGSYSHPGEPNDATSYYGCCDMSGNVWELTSEMSGSTYVMRGGNWASGADFCLCTDRSYIAASQRNPYVGFRLVRLPE